jgi:DNA-directed RNA polymerase specialized sigma24 family protein
MTEDEVIAIINNVANRLARRFKFGYHDIDDMKQQARLFAWEGLKSYDNIRPLENFLWTHVRNRLFNFKRDKYERPDKPCINCENYKYNDTDEDYCNKYCNKQECKEYSNWLNKSSRKRNIMHPIEFNNVDDDNEDNMKSFVDLDKELDHKEIFKIINEELPLSMRPLFLRLKFGTKIPKGQKIKIQTTIREILEKHGYDYE